MAWSLEIHHIDIQSEGDATLIVARDPAPALGPAVVRTMLIDGGKTAAAAIIDGYINGLGIAQVNVIAVTHYDNDHYTGITALLNLNVPRYNNAILYDTGRPPDSYRSRRRNLAGNIIPSQFDNYLAAITLSGVTRATVAVNSLDIVQYDGTNAATVPYVPGNAAAPANALLEPHWLIGKEILWGNGGDGRGGHPVFASNPPAGAPTVTCIAANKYVAQNGGGLRLVSNVDIFNGPHRMPAGQITDAENADDNYKSLGFVVQFNNFRYYIAGDLKQPQEDGATNFRVTTGPVFQPGVRAFLNNADNLAGRVLAIKPSHHGSDTSSSRVFVSQLRPSAAFISNGTGNQFRHPAQRTVNVLDGYPEIPILPDAGNQNRHPPTPPPSPLRPVPYFLTGYHDLVNLLSYGGDASETAGDPANNMPGHVRLRVTAAQSQVNVQGQVYRGVSAAAINAAAAPVNVAVNAANIAEAAASLGTAFAVAIASGAPVPQVAAALDAAAQLGNDANGVGVVQAALASQQGGGNAAAIAAAAAAGGLGARVAAAGAGTAAAIGQVMTGGNAGAISGAAQGAGASANASQAAGFAAVSVRARGQAPPNGVNGIDDAAYAAAAAIAAVNAGATVAQAAAIAAAIGSTIAVASVQDTAQAVTEAAMNAGMAAGLAAVVGAVAGASYYLGVPADVNTAVASALTQANFNVAAAAAGAAAQLAATVASPAQFTVALTIPGAVVGVGGGQSVGVIRTHS